MQNLKCSVYNECGGCSYQHLSHENYQNLKKSQFQDCFAHLLGDNSNILKDFIFIPPQTRRRTTLSFFDDGSQFVWGYKQHKSHKIIPANDCVIVTPKILMAMQRLPEFIKKIIKKDVQIKVSITEATNGLDFVIRGIKPPKAKEILSLNEHFFSLIPDAIRLIVENEIVGQKTPPIVKIADFDVQIPPDVFLQPSDQGQDILIKNVLDNLGKTNKKTKIIDLFSGLGTFTLPLAQKFSVDAYDNAGDAITILTKTLENYGFNARSTATSRDLFRDPLSFMELKKYDIAVLDPPRAGAEAQAKQLAKSSIKKIIYVFCDMNNARRDLDILIKGGYSLKSLVGIDQFTYSDHIEGVAILEVVR